MPSAGAVAVGTGGGLGGLRKCQQGASACPPFLRHPCIPRSLPLPPTGHLPRRETKLTRRRCAGAADAGADGARSGSVGRRRLELLIFDWDGTVVDSIKHIVLSWTSAFDGWHKRRAAERRSEGLGDVGVPAAGELKRCIGLSVEATVRRLVPDATEEDKRVITDLYRKHFRAGADSTTYFPAATDGLSTLSRQGFKMAVATGKSRRGLDREMTLLGAACWFASSRTADCTKSKPDPQMLLELMSESGACPESTVMIGDSVLDLQMAAAAGVRSIAVAFGAEPKEDLLRENPLYCADDWPSLVAFINGSFCVDVTALRP